MVARSATERPAQCRAHAPAHYALLAMLCLLPGALPEALAAEPNPQVKARRANGKLLLDVTMTVPVRAPLAFEVLSDYNHMANFVPGIITSKITRSNGNKLQVTQHGKAASGILSFSWESVREVTLNAPHEITSRVTGGSVKSGESSTRFIQEENQTRIIVHSESTASLLLPPLIGPAFVESQVRRQYNDFREEMLKRHKALEKANPAPAHPAAANPAATGPASGSSSAGNSAAPASASAPHSAASASHASSSHPKN